MVYIKTVAMVVMLAALLLVSASSLAQDDDGTVLFADDFSRFMDWTRQKGDAIYRDRDLGVLFWRTDQRPTDYYTVPLAADGASVRLSFRVNVIQAGTSGGIFVGLAESLAGAQGSPQKPAGIFVAITHTANGATIAYPRITYTDQPAQMTAALDDPATYIDLGLPHTWLGVDLRVAAGVWTLTITDASGQPTGQITGQITGELAAPHSAYRHLMIFYEAPKGETLIGQLDNVRVMGHFAAPPPELCAVSAETPYVSVRVGPGLNRPEWFALPANHPFIVIGWAEASDGAVWWQIRVPEAESDRTWVRQDQVTAVGACDRASLNAGTTPLSASNDAPDAAIKLAVGRNAPCIPMDGEWATDWLDDQDIGCPVNQAAAASAQYQRFEHGQVFFRAATDEIIILYDTRIYAIYLNTWNGTAALPCQLANSRGAIAYLWCIDPNVQGWLGLPTTGVSNLYEFLVQDFQQGMIFKSDLTGTVILEPDFIWD